MRTINKILKINKKNIVASKSFDMTSRGICNEIYWQTINVVDTCRKRATKPAAQVIAKARRACGMATGRRERQSKRFTRYLLPKSHQHNSVFVQKQGRYESSCNAQDQQATIQYLPPGFSTLEFDEPASADINDSCRSAPVKCVMHSCINV